MSTRSETIVRKYVESYATGLASLDYMYAIEMQSSLMTAEDNETKKDFIIDYTQKIGGGKENKDPLAAYAGAFGVQDAYQSCRTCSATGCQGHWGLIQFPEVISKGATKGIRLMITHPNYVQQVKDILSVVCQMCWRIMPNQDDPIVAKKLKGILAAAPAKRLGMLKALVGGLSKFNECTKTETTAGGKTLVCSTKYKIRSASGFKGKIEVEEAPAHQAKKKVVKRGQLGKKKVVKHSGDESNEDDEENADKITALQSRDIYEGFMMIGGKHGHTPDMEYLGLTKKQLAGFFMTNMLVMPTRYRPRSAKNDKLTVLISSIIATCAAYISSGKADNSHAKTLFTKVSDYFEAIAKKLGTKQGLVRSKGYGKRPNFTARTVIVPAEDIELGEMEVPQIVAEKGLIRRLLVTEDNIEALQWSVLNGKVAIINKVRGKNPWRDITVESDNFADKSYHILEVGDYVYPHLQDGDVIVTGRQPTQNQQNVFSVTARIVPGNTLGPKVEYCDPLGADFDGDTMYVFIPQTDEATGEITYLMDIRRNIRSHQKGTPIYGLKYNSEVASSLLTFPGTMVTQDLFDRCTYTYRDADRMRTLPERLARYGVQPLSGHALFSSSLPSDFYYKDNQHNPKVEIREGILLYGMLSAGTVGKGSGGIIDRMTLMYKPQDAWQVTAGFINDATKMLSVFIDAYGFSVSYDDCLFGQEAGVSVLLSEKLDEAKMKILRMKQPVTPYEKMKYEKEIQGIVNGIASVGTDIFINIEKTKNSLMVMSSFVSGAKGTENHLAWIGISTGQQMLLGKRMPQTVTDGTRTTITHRPENLFPEARGYIQESYVSGLTPNQSFHAAAAGKWGIVQTATSTKVIGQLQRYLQMCMENVVTDKGAALFRGAIVLDPCYGGDGMDGLSLMRVAGDYQSCDVATMIDIINNEARYDIRHNVNNGNQ
jgi:DNA-directed RNA polymerase beta' subunit